MSSNNKPDEPDEHDEHDDATEVAAAAARPLSLPTEGRNEETGAIEKAGG